MDPSGQPSRSAAQRRRERRLRSMLRHERMSVAKALAEKLHHSALQRPTMARARVEERDELHNATGQKTPLPRASSTVYFSLDDDGDVLAARPAQLMEVRPHERVLRRTVEQNVDAVTFPTLDDPMPQMVDQPLALLLSAHIPDPEQVIEVPKISLPSRPTRRFPRIVPLIDRWFIVQIADIPALRGPFGTGGLRGFLPGHAYSLSAEQIVDNPLPRRGFDGGLQGFHPGQSTAANASMSSAGVLACFMGNEMGCDYSFWLLLAEWSGLVRCSSWSPLLPSGPEVFAGVD